MAKKRRRKSLQDHAEAFALDLLFQASNGRVGKGGTPSVDSEEKENAVSFKDRRALLDSITKLLSNQKDKDDDEVGGLDLFKEHLRGDSGTPDSGTDPDDSSSEA